MKAFINGAIYTIDSKRPYAEAVLISNNKVKLAGSNKEIKSNIGKDCEVIDLNGRLMLPGFIDAHVHFMSGGYYLSGINLHNTSSVSEFVEVLKDYLANHKVEWITGGNWDHENWKEKVLPGKELIDQFTSETPVFLERMDKHIGLANSLALSLAGINKNTPDPPGGEILKDSSGEPTGILKDTAMDLVYSAIPKHTEVEDYHAALSALNEIKSSGITSIHDISYINDPSIYLQLNKRNKLTCRIYTILPIDSYKNLHFNKELFENGKIKFKALKAFADGSLGAGTAWFFEQYEDSFSAGIPREILINGKLEESVSEADKRGLQICTHAIGDKANSFVLDLYERIKNKNAFWDRRSRIEHAQHLVFKDILRFKELEIIASCQPYHLFFDGSWAEKKIGKERIKLTYPFKTFLNNKIKMCFGSDWPVVPINPLYGIYTAVTRQTSDNKNPEGWIPEQKISVEDAIKCYTLNGAYASFDEDKKGSIEPGKLADLVVLNENILKISPEKIKDAKVDMTIFDGEIIYSRT
jgi:predicted amidohydrolase YtcJ